MYILCHCGDEKAVEGEQYQVYLTQIHMYTFTYHIFIERQRRGAGEEMRT